MVGQPTEGALIALAMKVGSGGRGPLQELGGTGGPALARLGGSAVTVLTVEEGGLARVLCGPGEFSTSLALCQGSRKISSTPTAQTPVGVGETDRGTGPIRAPITVLLTEAQPAGSASCPYT